eukprot:994-Pelagomonas_calceolata.AAC.5
MDGVRVQLPGMLKNTRVLIQNFMEWELKHERQKKRREEKKCTLAKRHQPRGPHQKKCVLEEVLSKADSSQAYYMHYHVRA